VSSPVATSGRKILPEALLGGLPGDLQLRPDGLPGVLLDAGPLDGCGELGVGLAQLLVGRGDPAQYVERWLGRQPVGRDASAPVERRASQSAHNATAP